MKKQDNLNKAYQKALQNWEIPVPEEQWMRLSGNLSSGIKAKGIPLKWVLGLVLVSIITTWFFTRMYHTTSETNTNISQVSENNRVGRKKGQTPNNLEPDLTTRSAENVSKSEIGSTDNIINETPQADLELEPNTGNHIPATAQNPPPAPDEVGSVVDVINTMAPTEKSETTAGNNIQPAHSVPKELAVRATNSDISPTPADENGDEIASFISYSDLLAGLHGLGLRTFEIPQLESKSFILKGVIYPRPQPRQPSVSPYSPGLTASFSYGIAWDKSKFSSLSEPDKQHKDTREVFEKSNTELQTRFAQLGIYFRLAKGLSLGFQSGFQLRQIENHVSFDYTMYEIPFRDQDGSIIGYVWDSTSPMKFSYHGVNLLSFGTIPLILHYPLYSGPRQELLASFGGLFQFTIGARGKYFAINDAKLANLNRAALGKLNLGLITGVEYSYRIGWNCWLGLGAQWMQTGQRLNNTSGKINSKIAGTNLQLILKYKI